MKITLCGSIAFYVKMLEIKSKLEQMGHEVKLPPAEIPDENGKMIPIKDYYEKRKKETDTNSWIWDRKQDAIRWHFQKVDWSDAVLILNYDKNSVSGYIGPNTLMEMGIAFYLNKKILLLKDIPEIIYKEEILGMKPIVIDGDLSRML